MLQKILLTFLATIFICNVYGAEINFTDDIEAKNNYNTALEYFKQKDYKKALALFDKLVDKYPENEKINFYYGRSAFELKNYEFAFSAYDRILISNPTNHRVRLEYARTLFMMKSYKEAKKEFEAVLASPIPKVVRSNIEKFIQAIEDKEKNYILNKVAIFGFGWDDNINNNTDEHVNNIIPSLNNNVNKISDSNFKAILVGNLIVPNKTNNHISWESTGIAYMQEQRHYHDNDIFLISLTSGIGYTNQKYKNLTSVTYDHIWVGGDQTLYIYGLAHSIKYNIYKKHLLAINIKYKKKKWIQQTNRDKNSNIKELSLNYTLPIENTKDKVDFFTSYIAERKKNGTRVDVSKDTKKYKVSYSKNLFETYDINFAYQFEKNIYKEESTLAPKRDDDTRTATLGVTKKLDKTKTIAVEYNNIDNKSNNNTYTYKKQSVNLNYTLLF
jgi:tetratricopeptide (TPR) repeat protein